MVEHFSGLSSVAFVKCEGAEALASSVVWWGSRRPEIKAVPLGADVEIRVELVTDPVWFGPALDLRLWRRPPEGTGEIGFSPTAAGFRLPLYLAEVLCFAMQSAGELDVKGPSRR